jgi:diguanylate cyclase (GGDEF)-like protein
MLVDFSVEDRSASRNPARPSRDLEHENARLRRELQFKDHSISLLSSLNSNMRAALRVREVCYVMLTGVTAEPGLGFNRAVLFLKDPETGCLKGAMAISPDTEVDALTFYGEISSKRFGFEFYISEFYRQNLEVKNRLNDLVTTLTVPRDASNVLSEVLDERRASIVRDPRPGDFRGVEALAAAFDSEFIAAPVLAGNEEVGVILADNRFTRRVLFTEDALALQTLCDFAGSSILSARQYEEAEQLSIVDELTGLYNFRHLKEKIHTEIFRSRRYGRVFSLLIMDIDFFKNFNDRNGHLTGNRALMDLAALIRKSVRNVDFPARYGGEEFVVVLPETNRDGARITAEKLCQAVRATDFIGMENQPSGRVTISIGVASFPDDGANYDELIGAADRRLYVSKAEGKDRVVA